MVSYMVRTLNILFTLFFSSLVFSEESLTLYVVNYPPYMIVNSDNEISGMDVDVVSAAFQESGQSVVFEVLPWKRQMKLMQVGEIVGGLSCSKREGREKYMLFSDSISTTQQTVISRKGTNTDQITKLSDLKSYSVTTISGWGTENQLNDNGIAYVPSKDMRSALVSVLHRGVDVFYSSEIPTMHIAKKMNAQDELKVTYLDDVPANKLHLCLSQFYPNNDEVVASFNRGLNIIMQNGKYQEIQRKYF